MGPRLVVYATPNRHVLERRKLSFASWRRFETVPILAITIAENPVAYADDVFRRTENCPLCGATTESPDRIALYPVFDVLGKELSLGFGCWVHLQCLSFCPIKNQPTPIPW